MRNHAAVLFLLGGAMLWSGLAALNRRAVEQPLQFNHRLHTQDLGMECIECHRYARTTEFAGRPGGEQCSECHEEQLTGNPEEAKLAEHLTAGREIPWKRIYEVPDHVYFSHRRHVSVAEIGCEACHGEMALRASPPEGPLVRLSMDFCMGCHQEQKASVDCNACHR